MKKEDGAGVEFLGAVGVAATSLVDIYPLREGTAVEVGAIPTVGEE